MEQMTRILSCIEGEISKLSTENWWALKCLLAELRESCEELKRLLKDLRTKLVDTESALDRALASRDHRVEDAREGMRVAMQRAEKAEAELAKLRAHADRLQAKLDKLDNQHSFE